LGRRKVIGKRTTTKSAKRPRKLRTPRRVPTKQRKEPLERKVLTREREQLSTGSGK